MEHGDTVVIPDYRHLGPVRLMTAGKGVRTRPVASQHVRFQ